ncbi:MAG: transglutaminase family protein [Anaerolineales bacterium]|nr:transglutaminase family protein [Anaerolineales bacterium]
MRNEIDALLTLAADDNPKIAEEAQRALLAHGEAALPALRELADSDPTLAAQLSQRIEGRVIEEDWITLARRPDIEAAALLINRWYDPLLDPAQIRAQLDALAAPLQGQFDVLPPRQGAVALRDWLSGAKGFRGESEQYYAPENTMLSYTLRAKRGLPLTLSLLYLAVAARCGAPLYPIGIPSHFIVRYGEGDEAVFLDPFHKGVLLTRQDVQRFLVHQGVHWTPDHLEPMAAHPIVARMLRNLVNAYAMRGDAEQTWQVLRFLDLWMGAVG